MTTPPVSGIYRHHKGNLYRVLGVSRHSETQELLVLYQALYGDFGLWSRPANMFSERVDVNGAPIQRFALVEASVSPLADLQSSANPLS